jgi:hypothetical protein
MMSHHHKDVASLLTMSPALAHHHHSISPVATTILALWCRHSTRLLGMHSLQAVAGCSQTHATKYYCSGNTQVLQKQL